MRQTSFALLSLPRIPMHPLRSPKLTVVLCVLSLIACLPTPSVSQTLTSLRDQVISALTGGNLVDATLTGQMTYYVAGTSETRGITVQTTVDGSFRTDINSAEGVRVEKWKAGDGGEIVDAAGTVHKLDVCQTATPWMFPALVSALNSSSVAAGKDLSGWASSIGYCQKLKAISPTSRLIRMKIGAGGLPTELNYFIHSDDNLAVDIPVRVTYTDYRQTSGAMVPFRVQRYINGSLREDIQFTSAVLNSGISPSQFDLTPEVK